MRARRCVITAGIRRRGQAVAMFALRAEVQQVVAKMDHHSNQSKPEPDHVPHAEIRKIEKDMRSMYSSLATTTAEPIAGPVYYISTSNKKVDPAMFIAEDLDTPDYWLNKF